MKTWMENKRTKNLNECLKGNRIFGNNLEHGAKQQKSIGKESPKVEKRCGLLPEKEILEFARGQGTAGQVELRIIRVTPRTTALTRPTKRVALLAQDLPSTEVSHKKGIIDGTEVVDRKYAQTISDPSRRAEPRYSLRRTLQIAVGEQL